MPVIVVEDDLGMRQAIMRILSVAGMEFQSFSTAEQFLDSETAAAIEVLVVDVRLPGMSGLSMVRELGKRQIVPPVIFITSYDEPMIRHEAEKLGAVDFLPKPFRGADLLTSIQQATPRQ